VPTLPCPLLTLKLLLLLLSTKQVGNYTIRLSMLNKDAKWTKALKLMLADLKVALQVNQMIVLWRCR
jgi:hypothetical protein